MSATNFYPADAYALDESHIEDATALLTRAFFDYPMWAWVMPDEQHRREALPLAMRAVSLSRPRGASPLGRTFSARRRR